MTSRLLRPLAAAALAALACAPTAAAADGGSVLLRGYAAPGVGEASVLGADGLKAPASGAGPVTADDLAAASVPAPQLVGTARGLAPHARRARSREATRRAQRQHAPAAVVAAAERTPSPGDGLRGMWIFGGALVALAGAAPALWRRKAR